MARSAIRNLELKIIWKPVSIQRFFRDINTDCDLPFSALSCNASSELIYPFKSKERQSHSSTVHGDQDRTDPSPAAASHIWGTAQRLQYPIEAASS
jgi:hypothetical protein